jgi:hypothetical protein
MDYLDIKRVENLTPHAVRVCVGNDIITVPPSGKIARLKMRSKPHGTVHGMPVSLSSDDGVYHILSGSEIT